MLDKIDPPRLRPREECALLFFYLGVFMTPYFTFPSIVLCMSYLGGSTIDLCIQSTIFHQFLSHSFFLPHPHPHSGVMFPLSVHRSLPVSSIYMTSISVRGDLGNVSVYVKMSGDLDPDADVSLYEG